MSIITFYVLFSEIFKIPYSVEYTSNLTFRLNKDLDILLYKTIPIALVNV